MHLNMHARCACALLWTLLNVAGCGISSPADESAAADAGKSILGGDGSYPFLQVLAQQSEAPPASGLLAEVEPDGTIEQANLINDVAYIEIDGSISADASSGDVDVYRFNGGGAGVRVQTSLVVRGGSGLVVSLLDDRQHLLAYADPGSTVNGPRAVDLVLREATDALFVVVAGLTPSEADRPYTVRFERLPVEETPAARPQVIVLNFAGASSVQIGRRSPVDVPPFTAESISSNYDGQTDTMINLVLGHVREHFAGLGIEVFLAGDPSIPIGDLSTVHFGTFDPSLLGLADSIDPLNSLARQNAIVYTDAFRLFNVFSPSVEEIAKAMANTASHEAGAPSRPEAHRRSSRSDGHHRIGTADARRSLVPRFTDSSGCLADRFSGFADPPAMGGRRDTDRAFSGQVTQPSSPGDGDQ